LNRLVISLVCLFFVVAAISIGLIGRKQEPKPKLGIVLSGTIRTRDLNPTKEDAYSDDSYIWDIHGVIEDYELIPPVHGSYPIFILHFKDGRIIPMVIQGDPIVKGVEITIYYKVWSREGGGQRIGNYVYEIRIEQ